MKLKEALKELDNEAFNINYNFNKAQWELVIFNQDFDILEEYESKYLKDLLQSYLKETVEFNHSNEPYIIEDRNRKVEINFGNTEDEENTFQIIFDVFGNLDTEIKDLKDLVKRLENINQEFRDLEMSASERLYPARAYL
ncbi:hypothetical protein FNSP10_13290 [Fusobacterium nucleatum]|nr:hypothetical protein FNCP10_11030 [Fusobacterium nucleatum]BEP07955.1 hypothetical protein FNSP10_13290 [Fusobacterium nucleatum]